MKRSAWFLVLVAVAVAIETAPAAERPSGGGNSSPVEAALQYDFLPGEAPKISDASGKRHDGLLKDGEIVYGRNKHAVKFDGRGMVSIAQLPDTLNPAARPLTVGAYCQPTSPDGVVAAMGDKRNGFSLYIKNGFPVFAVRANGELFKAADTSPVVMDQWVHLAGMIDAQGKVTLAINSWPVATVQGKLIPHKPARGLSFGADVGTGLGDYPAPLHWQGLLQDARLFWGVVDRNENRDLWGDWAHLPGCGCRK